MCWIYHLYKQSKPHVNGDISTLYTNKAIRILVCSPHLVLLHIMIYIILYRPIFLFVFLCLFSFFNLFLFLNALFFFHSWIIQHISRWQMENAQCSNNCRFQRVIFLSDTVDNVIPISRCVSREVVTLSTTGGKLGPVNFCS